MSRPIVRSGILGALLLATFACGGVPRSMKTRDLSCGTMHDPRMAALCRRIEPELEYVKGGHATLFGGRAYHCTTKTVYTVFCTPPGLSSNDLAALQAEADSPDPTQVWDFRLHTCVQLLRDAIRDQKTPPVNVDPRYVVRCPVEAK